jgi:hypothetical protein
MRSLNATGQANAKIAKLLQLSLIRAKIKIGPSGFQRTANVYEIQKATIYLKNAADREEANIEGIDRVIKKLNRIGQFTAIFVALKGLQNKPPAKAGGLEKALLFNLSERWGNSRIIWI